MSCPPEKVIAEHLIEVYGLEPYVRSDGKIGIHFMDLEWSQDDPEETLLKLVQEEISWCRTSDGFIPPDGGDSSEREHLREWRNTLQTALKAIESALAET